MISIKKPNAPEILVTKGQEAKARLCEAYLKDQGEYIRGKKTFDFSQNIYASVDVKTILKSTQHRKCAFCESIFDHTGYGDVEHFRPKAGYKQSHKNKLQRPGYYWLAYDWDNLFISCQLCNQQYKKNLFPLKSPRSRAKSHLHELTKETPLLIHPARMDIEDFIGFDQEYASAIDNCVEGVTTIEVFGLNRPALVENRRESLTRLKDLVDLRAELRETLARQSAPALHERLRSIEGLLKSRIEPQAEYSAMSKAYCKTISLDL